MINIRSLFLLTLLTITSCDNNHLTIVENYYSESGNLKEKYFIDKDGLLQGTYTIYFDNTGNKMETRLYIDGEINGLYKEYYSNGEIKMKTNIKNGLEVDTSFFYQNNGRLLNYSIYDSLGRHLKDAFFYLDGKPKEIRAFYVERDNSSIEIASYKAFNIDGSLNLLESHFCKVRRVNSQSVILELLMKNNCDSVKVNIVRSFNYNFSFDADVIRSYRFGKTDKILVDFNENDYFNKKLNIQILTEDWNNTKLIKVDGYDIQIDTLLNLPIDHIGPIYR